MDLLVSRFPYSFHIITAARYFPLTRFARVVNSNTSALDGTVEDSFLR